MITCAKCKKTLEKNYFQKKRKNIENVQYFWGKNIENKKIWREKNKKRISAYSQVYNSKDKEVKTILIREIGKLEYQKFLSLQDCCKTQDYKNLIYVKC